MAEGIGLLNQHTSFCIMGSNPISSVIQKIFDQINSSLTIDSLFEKIIDLDINFGFLIPINSVVQPSLKDSNLNILHISSGGLGLPDRDYYFVDSKENIRSEYLKFITK